MINDMSSKPFEKDVAIVTGAGQGIGREICRQLCQLGASVILNDINDKLVDEAANEIRSNNGNCIGMAGDASDAPFILKIVEEATRNFGQLTMAVANAGITLFGDFFDYAPAAFERVLKVNLGGSFYLAQAAAKQMRLQGKGGRIVFMSSVTGHQAHKDLAAYAMTKAGLEMLAKNLVIDLSPYGITVNALAPGATVTERTKEDPDYEKTWSTLTPMGRPARVEDIADAALFLLSQKASHITGQTLIIDGGWSSISPSPF
jgi:NAD(P)-dependent dehydrogenase (short-subunit alcohol dehydrogenase family)